MMSRSIVRLIARVRDVVVLGMIVVMFLAPVAVLVVMSASGTWSFPQLLPETFSSRSVRFVLDQASSILRSLGVSLLYSLGAVVLSFVLSVLPASVLARDTFRGKSIVEALLLAPVLLPSITFALGLHFFFIKFGLADSLAGVILILTLFSYPYMLRALITGFLSIPEDLETASLNLGASRLGTLVRVVIPLLLPSLIAGGSIVFLASFSNYFLVFLIGTGDVPSYTGYLFPFLGSSDWSTASLLTLLFLVIPILLVLILDMTLARSFRTRGLE